MRDQTLYLQIECTQCEKETLIVSELSDWLKFIDRKEPIQKIYPHMPPDHRELLISGICGKCYDNSSLYQELPF